MLEIFGMLLSGVFTGGATGLLGLLLQRYFDLQHKKQDIEALKLNLANSVELSKMESDRARLRADTDIRISETESEAEKYKSDNELMAASYENDKAQYLDKESMRKEGKVAALVMFMMAFVDFFRGMLRPGMTVYLCFVVTYMFYWVRDLAAQYGNLMTSDNLQVLIVQIISTILYAFTTATVWWYGSRPAQPNSKK